MLVPNTKKRVFRLKKAWKNFWAKYEPSLTNLISSAWRYSSRAAMATSREKIRRTDRSMASRK